MAGKGVITGKEVLDGVKEEIAKTDASLIKLIETYNTLLTSATNYKNVAAGTKISQEANKANAEASKLAREKARLEKEEANAIAAKNRALITEQSLIKAKINAEKSALALTKQKNAAENAAKGARSSNLAQLNNLNSAYAQQSRLLIALRNRQKDLNTIQALGGKLTSAQANELKKLSTQVRSLDASLKKVDRAAGQFQRNVGNYPKLFGAAASSVRSFASAFGFTSGIFLFAQAIKSAIKTIKDFDQSQADIAAILGRTRNEISALTEQAKRLGSTTAFTATEVAKLQLELAKLGFDDSQIIDATLGIENLAIATGVDAARAAKLAGSAIRGFNLDVSEANRVAAALAVSTTKSASSFETLEIALPKVSAIAKSFGFTIEDTTALLGGLQNAGFEASIAGTSLRQIFLQLADSNGKLATRLGGGAKNFDELIEQFKKVEKEGISLSEAFNLTNARSVAAFKVFLQGADDLKKLRDGIVDVEDELDQLAETKLDSVTGQITLLNSAYEGFLINIDDGKGVLSKFIKEGLAEMTKSINDLDFVLNNDKSLWDKWRLSVNLATNQLGKSVPFLQRLTGGGGLFAESTKRIQEETRARQENAAAIQLQIDKYVRQFESLAPFLDQDKYGKHFSFFGDEDVSESDKFRRTLTFINQEIKDLQELQEGLTATDEASIKSIANKIRALEKERDIILDVRKKEKDSKVIIEGTIEAYEKFIKEQEELRDSTARTTEEYASYNEAIDDAKKKIEDLVGAIKILNDTPNTLASAFGADTLDRTEQDNLANGYSQKGRDAADAERKKEILAEKQKLQAFKALKQGFIDDINDLDKKQTENLEAALKQRLDLEKKSQEAKEDFVFSGIDGIFQKRVEDVERELELNQTRLDAVLNSENASDEQKEIARRKAASDEAKLEKEKKKREKEAFLVRQGIAIAEIAINLARTISAINLAGANLAAAFPVGGIALQAAYVSANVPLAIGTAALQTGAVIAQSIPAFFKGKNAMDNYEGMATWGEHRPEVLVSEDGSIQVSPDATTPIWVKRKDLIVPSIDQFHREVKNPDSDVFKRVSQKINSDTSERKQMVVVNNSPMDTKGIEEVLEKVMYKYSKRAINVKNTIKMPEQRTRKY